MTELEPCPFCGGPAQMIEAEEAGDSAYAIQCQTRGCEASSRVAFALMDSVDDLLAEAWNRRAPTDSQARLLELEGENERLRAALTDLIREANNLGPQLPYNAPTLAISNAIANARFTLALSGPAGDGGWGMKEDMVPLVPPGAAGSASHDTAGASHSQSEGGR